MSEHQMTTNSATAEERPAGIRPVLPEEYGMPKSEEGLLPWSRVQEQLESAKNFWVATCGADGRPHAVPVWGAWFEGVLYFDGHPQTRWGRNLATNPAISVHLESGDHVVILEGRVTDQPTIERSLAERLAVVFGAKYDFPYEAEAENWIKRGLYYLKPSLVLAWDEFPKTLTRWRFD